MNELTCRLCGAELKETFVDLGSSPPCETYLTAGQVDQPEAFYPLHVRICSECLLVELLVYVDNHEIFSDYAYFSSYSDSWVAHAGRFVDEMADQLALDATSLIVEVASNDGYLLHHVVRLPIACSASSRPRTSQRWLKKGIPTEVAFLGGKTGAEIADQYGKADLVVGNNVFAHTPELLDFARGLRALLADDGLVSLEFPTCCG